MRLRLTRSAPTHSSTLDSALGSSAIFFIRIFVALVVAVVEAMFDGASTKQRRIC